MYHGQFAREWNDMPFLHAIVVFAQLAVPPPVSVSSEIIDSTTQGKTKCVDIIPEMCCLIHSTKHDRVAPGRLGDLVHDTSSANVREQAVSFLKEIIRMGGVHGDADIDIAHALS